MYYIQIFQNDIGMIDKLIDKFVIPFLPNVIFLSKESIWQLTDESMISSIKSNLIDSKYFDLIDFTFLHTCDESLAQGTIVPLNFSSVQHLNELVDQLTEQFEWVMLTCGDHSFKEIIVATKFQFINQYLEEKTVEIIRDERKDQESIHIPSIIATQRDYEKILAKHRDTNFLISKYLFNDNCSSCFKAIVFKRLDKIFDRLLESLNIAAKDMTLVCSHIPYECKDFVTKEIINLSFSSWNVLPLLGSQELGRYQEYSAEKELFVLNFNSIESLSRTCYDLKSSEADTILIIPRKTNLSNLKKAFTESLELGSENLCGYEFAYASIIANSVEWYYGIDRIYWHDCCYIFMSNNADLITQFDSLNIKDGYQLVGCF